MSQDETSTDLSLAAHETFISTVTAFILEVAGRAGVTADQMKSRIAVTTTIENSISPHHVRSCVHIDGSYAGCVSLAFEYLNAEASWKVFTHKLHTSTEKKPDV